MPAGGIDQHVARAAIKGDALRPPPGRWNIGQVGYAADIYADHAATVRRKKYPVKVRHQGRPLPAQGHIRRTKITHHRNTGQRRQHRGVSGLPGGTDAYAGPLRLLRLMPQGLPVAADVIYPLSLQVSFPQKGFYKSGPNPGQGKINRGDGAEVGPALFNESQQRVVQGAGIFIGGGVRHTHVRTDAGTKFHAGDIQTVAGGAGHQTQAG